MCYQQPEYCPREDFYPSKNQKEGTQCNLSERLTVHRRNVGRLSFPIVTWESFNYFPNTIFIISILIWNSPSLLGCCKWYSYHFCRELAGLSTVSKRATRLTCGIPPIITGYVQLFSSFFQNWNYSRFTQNGLGTRLRHYKYLLNNSHPFHIYYINQNAHGKTWMMSS